MDRYRFIRVISQITHGTRVNQYSSPSIDGRRLFHGVGKTTEEITEYKVHLKVSFVLDDEINRALPRHSRQKRYSNMENPN